MSEAVLMVGTRKGLWIGRSDESREVWTWDEPRYLMQEVYSVAVDDRGASPRLFAGVTSMHIGPQVYWSDDLGRTWSETANGGIRFPEDTGETLTNIWQIQPGLVDEPDVVYAGTQPSALFRSTDRGETFSMVRSLWDHPHRTEWGAGFGGQAIHTIVPNAVDKDKMAVAMSTGGVYRTADGGESWSPANVGIKAYFFPDPWPEFGQCVHKVASHPSSPDRMFAQNHHGVYRTDDGGDKWESIADGLPSDFGFAMVVHPRRPDTIYNFPLVADGERIPPGAKARVWRSDDAGETWLELAKGLPDRFFSAVMRDAMCVDGADPAGVYFGSRDGSVFASHDDGDSWALAGDHFPDVLTVRAAVL
ncbi:MAG: WD40/YVTN/BNR-like repeat-containing protein [Nocardioidaceae bacterium]